MTYNPNKPFAPGDKVLVSATITEVNDDDPHDPQVIVWFNGQPHSTTVMNLQHDNSKKPTTRSSWGTERPEFPVTIPTPVESPKVFSFNSVDFDDPADLIADVPRHTQPSSAPEEVDVDALIDLVKTPADEDDEPRRPSGRTAPSNQHAVFDGRGRRGVGRSTRGSNVIAFPDKRGRLFSASNDTDDDTA